MVKDIDRSEQQILGGVLKYSDTAPGPNTKKSVKIEKTRFGLRVYGKGPNRNKLVVHTIYPPENRSNSPKEQVPLDEAVYVGNAYEINKFRVVHNRRSSKVIPHAAMIELNKNTTIVPIHKTSQELPMHWFNLIELDQLHQRINNDVELTGNKFNVFGCLTAVQPTEEITIQKTRVAKKRNLRLQNIKDESVRITLWGETATNFENSGIQSLLPPVFVALTSLKVNQYQGNPVLGSTGSTVCVFNPEIPQLSEYKHKFKHLRSPVQILPTSAEMYTGRTVDANAESKTIDQLLLLDPTLHKVTTIVGFDLTRGWWYKSCPSCHKVVRNNSGSFECNEHSFINRLPEPW
ncbi:unnamed protein product [Malus baccata var. baccata]